MTSPNHDEIAPPSGAADPRLERVAELSREMETQRQALLALAVERSQLIRDARQSMTLGEIGEALGITRQAVARLEKRD